MTTLLRCLKTHFQDWGLRFEEVEIEKYYKQMADMYIQCCIKYGDIPEPIEIWDLFKTMSKAHVEWYGFFSQSGLISFCGCFYNNGSAILSMYGRYDKEESLIKDSHAYFYLQYKMFEIMQIKEIYIETRPELITDENIAGIKRSACDKTISVAIGLESSNDYIRNKIHDKGVAKEVFEKAMKILSDHKIHPLIYVFVKPAVKNMTDEETISDALETINYSFEKGAYMVELECGYIVENSAMYDLYQEGKYTPLTLWSIRELLIKALEQKKGIVRLAYFSDTPKPIAGPYNCDKCSDRFFEMFDLYRKTMDANVLYQEITCTCRPAKMYQ